MCIASTLNKFMAALHSCNVFLDSSPSNSCGDEGFKLFSWKEPTKLVPKLLLLGQVCQLRFSIIELSNYVGGNFCQRW